MRDAVPSRSTITKAVLVASLSITLMTVFSVTSSMTVKTSGLPGRRPHRETGLFGSASMIVTLAPLVASWVASRTAEVDFPAPPFGEANTMVGMWTPLTLDDSSTVDPRETNRLITVGQPKAVRQRITDC